MDNLFKKLGINIVNSHLAINALMPRLLAAVQADPLLRERWYQCEFLSSLSGDMLVGMIYLLPMSHTSPMVGYRSATRFSSFREQIFSSKLT